MARGTAIHLAMRRRQSVDDDDDLSFAAPIIPLCDTELGASLLLLATTPVCVRSRPRVLRGSFALGDEARKRRQASVASARPSLPLALAGTRAAHRRRGSRKQNTRSHTPPHRPPIAFGRARLLDMSERINIPAGSNNGREVTVSRRGSDQLHWLSLAAAPTPTLAFTPTRLLSSTRTLYNHQFAEHPLSILCATQKLSVNKQKIKGPSV